MQEVLKLTSFLFLLLSFSVNSQEISAKQQKHIHDFTTAVESHNSKKTIQLLDKAYRKKQLAFLEGNKVQFSDELFSGYELGTENYVNVSFPENRSFTVVEVIQLKEGGYTYIFNLKYGELDIYCSLLLVKKGEKFNFIGAVG